jgi:hypothetical protein
MMMLRTAKLILIAAMGTACFTVAAFAEDAPNCPGGNLKGTFHCTGPIGSQTCSEGPPWHCEHPPETDPPKAMGGFGSANPHPRFNNVGKFSGNLMVLD